MVEPSATRPRLQTFSSLSYHSFLCLWIGTLFMGAGQWIQQVTLAWLVYELTASSVLLGTLSALRALPFLIAAPMGGIAADRLDRRKLLLAIETFLAASAFAMGLLIGSGLLEIWHLFAFGTITAVAWAFTAPVRQSLVSDVVPRDELMNAVALNSLGFNITKIVGPALGGALIAWVGATGNFLVQGVAYATVLIFIFYMQTPPAAKEARRSSVFANLKEGVAYIRATPTMFALMVAALVPNIFAMPYQLLMPVFQKDVLGVGPDGLGLMLAAPGVGAVAATIFLASIAHSVPRRGALLLGALFFLGTFLVLFSQMRAFPLALAMLVGVGACQVFYAATTNTLIQIMVPDELRGRVMSIYMLDHGLSPAGAMLAGVSTHYVGAPTTVAVMGCVVMLLAVIVAWRLPSIRTIEA